MDFNEYNLRQLLELGLRFPEMGAVNFNIVYLILKTIIKRQGMESLTPNFTFVCESPSDAKTEEESIDEEKEQRMVQMEKEIHKLNETIEKLSKKFSELEVQPVQKVEESEPAVAEEERRSLSEPETKVSDEPEFQELPKGKEADEGTKVDEEKKLERKFSWHKNRLFKQKLEDIKKEVESLKENDQGHIWAEVETLQVSNEYIVEKFDELLQDFDTVMNGYSKLGMQVEELDKNVNKKIKIEDDLKNLKQQTDQLEKYVYSGKHETVEEETESPTTEASPKEEEDPEMGRAEVVEARQEKVDRRIHFAKIVQNLLERPEEKRAHITRGSIEPEVKRVEPMTTKKSYEAFITAAQEARTGKEERVSPEVEVKDEEEAATIAIPHPEEQAKAPDAVVGVEMEPPVQGTVHQKLHTVAQAITLVQEMRKTQRTNRLVKARRKEAVRGFWDEEDEEVEQLSAESFEIPQLPPQQLAVTVSETPPAKATLLFGDEKASQELKERIVLYVRSRVEGAEVKWMDQLRRVESSIIVLKDENEELRKDIEVSKSKLAVVETSQNQLDARITDIEEKANLNELHFEEMVIARDKKADLPDAVRGVSREDASILEDRMLQLNEATLRNIEELRSFSKDYTIHLRDELGEKVSGFDVDCRLEPLAGRLKMLERLLKDVTFRVRVIECQSMGPIEVKRYLHCEDGKRIKPLRRPVSLWTSGTRASSLHDDEENAEKIEADVQKRLEDAIFRDAKHLIGGAHTKVKVARM